MPNEYWKDKRLWTEVGTCGLWGLIIGSVGGALIGGGRGFYQHATEFYTENSSHPVWATIGAAFAGIYGLAVQMPWGLAIGASIGLVLGILRGLYKYHRA